MTTQFARFNIQLEASPDLEASLADWESLLTDAAIEGLAEEQEFFYIAEKRVIGISVPFDSEDPQTLLEAGAALGYCHAACVASERTDAEQSWLSINASDDSIISTTVAV